MAEQYLRKASLVIANGADGIELNEFRFTFKVKQADLETPQSCTVRVYNLAPDTANRIAGPEFSRMILQAGYQSGNYGIIFDGSIIQARKGRESETDTFVDIIAAEGDMLAFNWTSVSIGAGASQEDVLAAAVQYQNAIDTKLGLGYIPPLPGATLPRGVVMYGMTRDVLHTIAASTGSTYFIRGTEINFVPLEGVIPGEYVLLNSQTGMIGWPTQTQDGIETTCLLNPLLAVGSAIQINNASILEAQYSAAYGYIPENLPQLDYDGLYRVYVIEHQGDTRGLEWYSKLTCLSVDPANARLTGLLSKGQF